MKKNIFFFAAALTFNFALLTFNCTAQYTKLLDFDSINGGVPEGSLISDGTFLYGMTSRGGINNEGTVFKIKPDGTGYTKLLDFDSINGLFPWGDLISDGTFLYGMTWLGGTNNMGVIFKIKPDGTGYTKLLDFNGAANGNRPFGSLISDGTFLYGMTQYGGTGSCNPFGCGTIFKIKPDGTGYIKLHDFSGTDGRGPDGSLISDGTFLYGMTSGGGTNGNGTIFKIMPNGLGFTKLLDFTGANGDNPLGTLIYDGTFLYGMTTTGGTGTCTGSNGCGVIFKIMSNGAGYVKLHDFDGDTNGGQPLWGGLILDGTFLVGMTSGGGYYGGGVIFKIKSDGTGYSDLFDFNPTDGQGPGGSLIYDGTFFYGMTSQRGTGSFVGAGTIFKYQIAPAGIAENNMSASFDIYPNPSHGTFQISITKNNQAIGVKEIKVFNLLGEVVWETGASANNIFTIDITVYPQGIYYVHTINDQNEIEVKKIVKQ